MTPAEDPGADPGSVPGRPGSREGVMRYTAILTALLLATACILAAPYLEPPFVLSILVILFSGILYLIRGTRGISLSIIILALLYGLGWLPLVIFVTTIGIVAAGEIAYRASRGGHHRYITYLAAASAGGGAVILYLTGIGYVEMSPSLLLIVLLGILVAVLIKSVLGDRHDVLMVEGLAVAMTMYLFADLSIPVENIALLTAAALIAFTFAYFAYRFRLADVSGLFSGAIVGIIIIVFTWHDYRVGWFLVLLGFLVLGAAATRYRFEGKAAAGVAESHGGMRGYVNVFSNALVGVAAAVLYGLSGGNVLFTALYLGSVATATADTVGGEIGMTSHDPVLITTLEPVPKGTNGGVTLLGEAASLAGAAAIALLALLLGIADPRLVLFVTLAGFVGSNVDSLVGALLENRGFFGNAGTNLAATLAGGLLALALCLPFL